jgi:hypothetical protein
VAGKSTAWDGKVKDLTITTGQADEMKGATYPQAQRLGVEVQEFVRLTSNYLIFT